MIRKNVAGQRVFFGLTTPSGGTLGTGTTQIFVGLDGGAISICSNATHVGQGLWRWDPVASDVNADYFGMIATNSSAAVPVVGNFITTGGDFRNAVNFGMTALPGVGPNVAGGLATVGTNLATLADVGFWRTVQPLTLSSQAVQATLVANAIDSTTATVAFMNRIADFILRRNAATARVSADGDALTKRSLLGAVSKLVNRVQMSGANNLRVYAEDDASAFFDQTVTTTATASFFTDVDTVA